MNFIYAVLLILALSLSSCTSDSSILRQQDSPDSGSKQSEVNDNLPDNNDCLRDIHFYYNRYERIQYQHAIWVEGQQVRTDEHLKNIFAHHISDTELSYISKTESIEHLSLYYCRKVTDEGVSKLWELPNLKSISLLKCTQLSDAAFNGISSAKNLRGLRLDWCTKITGVGWASHVPDSLSVLSILGCIGFKNDCLYELVCNKSMVDFACSGDVQLDRRVIKEVLKSCTYFYLSRCEALSEEDLLAGIRVCENLEQISLSYNDTVNDRIATELSLTGVSKVNLSGCINLLDGGLASLSTSSGLLQLNLTSCDSITVSGLIRLLESKPTLSLILDRNVKLSSQDVDRLIERFPNADISSID